MLHGGCERLTVLFAFAILPPAISELNTEFVTYATNKNKSV